MDFHYSLALAFTLRALSVRGGKENEGLNNAASRGG
jgi:hypothetical protein